MSSKIGESRKPKYKRNKQRVENKRPSNLNGKENLIVLN